MTNVAYKSVAVPRITKEEKNHHFAIFTHTTKSFKPVKHDVTLPSSRLSINKRIQDIYKMQSQMLRELGATVSNQALVLNELKTFPNVLTIYLDEKKAEDLFVLILKSESENTTYELADFYWSVMDKLPNCDYYFQVEHFAIDNVPPHIKQMRKVGGNTGEYRQY